MSQPIPTLRWEGGVDGHLVLLDQTRLPNEVVELHCRTVQEVWLAIKGLAVRGAPAIGVAAAYGVCLSLRPQGGRESFATGNSPSEINFQVAKDSRPLQRVLAACDYLATSRPTAVNLFYALNRMRAAARGLAPNELPAALLAEARLIDQEDAQMSAAIGQHGADLLADLPAGAGILTHCNAGALVTTGPGTALAVVYELARRGKRPHVWVDETRPLLQGARLTAWELTQRGVDCTLICDSMAAQVMREGRVQAVIVGADRIAANGDVANKIGTYGVALLAHAHNIPFYVAAPTSTFDRSIATGDDIPIEQRAAEEVTRCACHWRVASAGGKGSLDPDASLATRQWHDNAPVGVNVYNPAFDVTPARLIRAIITENGPISP